MCICKIGFKILKKGFQKLLKYFINITIYYFFIYVLAMDFDCNIQLREFSKAIINTSAIDQSEINLFL